MIELRPVHGALPSGIERLGVEATTEGFRFLDRLVAEYNSGSNRFDRAGECLLGAHDESGLIAIGGLNIDTYARSAEIGRIRRFYVSRTARSLAWEGP